MQAFQSYNQQGLGKLGQLVTYFLPPGLNLAFSLMAHSNLLCLLSGMNCTHSGLECL